MSGLVQGRLLQVQVGTLGELQYPALLPFDSTTPWLLIHDFDSQPLATEMCEGVALQLLGQHAVGLGKLLLFEAAPSPNFAQIKRLLAASNQSWGEQIVTARDCLKRLTELEELTHRRFTLLAEAGAADIYAYNATTSHAEPVIYLLISGLGSALSDSEPLRQLEMLCEQGPTVGIVPLLLNNSQKQADTHTPDTRKNATKGFWETVQARSTGLDMHGEQPLNIPAKLWELLRRFGLQLGLGQLCNAWTNQLLVATQKPEDSNGERDFLNIRIGLAGAIPAYFSMGEKSDVYHALIGGATRTGKTTLLNNLLINACEAYTPDELQLTLMDFKEGVSFWDYDGLGHVAQLYAPNEGEFADALSCLEQFEQQISARYTLFRTARVSRLSDYNLVAQQRLPRHMLVVDEAQSLFEGRDFKQKAAVKRILSSVAKKGAAAGLHIILSTQSFQNVELEGDVKDQFHLRIGFRHASAMGCRALMGRDNDAMLNLPRFTAIYNSHQGEEKLNRVVALDNLADFNERLDALKTKYPTTHQDVPSLASQQIEVPATAPIGKFADGNVSGEW